MQTHSQVGYATELESVSPGEEPWLNVQHFQQVGISAEYCQIGYILKKKTKSDFYVSFTDF